MEKGVDFIGVGIGVIIINKERKLFASMRGPKARNEVGKWEFPGGAVEFGHTLEETVLREMKEEFGIDVEILDVLGTCNHIIPREKQHWVTTGFICRISKGIPNILEPEKCEKIGWFTIDELANMNVSSITNERIIQLRKKYLHGLPNFKITR